MTEVRWLDEHEQRAWRALQFMQLRLSGRLAADVGATSDLSYADYLVLVALSDQPDGRARLFELVEALGWEKSRVSHQVARMTGRGLCERSGATATAAAPSSWPPRRAARRSRRLRPTMWRWYAACSSTRSPPASSTPSPRPPRRFSPCSTPKPKPPTATMMVLVERSVPVDDVPGRL